MQKLKSLSLAMAVALTPQFAQAFSAADDVANVEIPLGRCSVLLYVRDSTATAYALIRLSPVVLNYTNGTYFDADGIRQGGTIDETLISACLDLGPGNVIDLQQNGADGTYATDNYIGFRFTTAADSLDQNYPAGTYEFRIGSGESGFPPLPSEGLSVDDIAAEASSFMQSRARQLAATQPDLTGLMTGSAGRFNVAATQSAGTLDLATNSERPVWAQLSGNWSETDGAETNYFAGSVGAHMDLSATALLGLMVSFDKTTQTDGDVETTGTGYLVGPYLVAKLPSQPLYFEARALAGTSTNDITNAGTEVGTFDTDRVLAKVKVSGEVAVSTTTLTPSLAATYVQDDQAAFTDVNAIVVAAQDMAMTDVTAGLDFATPISVATGELTLKGGIAGVWSQAEANAVTTETGYGRVNLGFSYLLDSGLNVSANAIYDGIGEDNYESLGVNLQASLRF